MADNYPGNPIIGVRVPIDTKIELEDRAQERGMTVSQILRALISDYLR